MEGLAVAVAADDVGVVVGDDPPEVLPDRAVAVREPFLPHPYRADHLRDLGVGVQSGEPVLALRQRVEHPGVDEAFGDVEPAGVSGERVQIGQHVVHPAELGLQHPLHVLVAQPARARVDPLAHPQHHVEGLVVPGQPVLVDQPRHDLVQGVVGRPDARAGLQPVEEALRERRQIALAVTGRR